MIFPWYVGVLTTVGVVMFLHVSNKYNLPRVSEGTFTVTNKYTGEKTASYISNDNVLEGTYRKDGKGKQYTARYYPTGKYFESINVGDVIKVRCIRYGRKLQIDYFGETTL